jgi:hypothetical protein
MELLMGEAWGKHIWTKKINILTEIMFGLHKEGKHKSTVAGSEPRKNLFAVKSIWRKL